jgi:hypothetical protein
LFENATVTSTPSAFTDVLQDQTILIASDDKAIQDAASSQGIFRECSIIFLSRNDLDVLSNWTVNWASKLPFSFGSLNLPIEKER